MWEHFGECQSVETLIFQSVGLRVLVSLFEHWHWSVKELACGIVEVSCWPAGVSMTGCIQSVRQNGRNLTHSCARAEVQVRKLISTPLSACSGTFNYTMLVYVLSPTPYFVAFLTSGCDPAIQCFTHTIVASMRL